MSFFPRAMMTAPRNDPSQQQHFPCLYFSRLKQIKIILSQRDRYGVQIAFTNYLENACDEVKQAPANGYLETARPRTSL